MTVHTPPPEGGRIVDEPMSEALSRRYLAYALSTITNRALPDVRDGFKPVHRRIMYAMHQMRLNPQAAARKCAKVVGEVMGGYHPHGDASIGAALVAIGQRAFLIEPQGNYGNMLTGDEAAAPRDIEARLTPFAKDVLFNPKTTTWQLSYDGRAKEPVTLPFFLAG
jgi:topoisomerase-4 subunit A